MYKTLLFILLALSFSNPIYASDSKFMKEINSLAQEGYVDAQYNLARIYSNGESVDQDLELAAYWFLQAAEQDNRDAQYQLARMFENGLGVGIDLEEAFRWYKLSAEQGRIEAQYSLGLAYRFGIGGFINHK